MFGVVDAVIMLHLVSQVLSSCHIWCCGHCHYTTFSVAGTIVVPHLVLWSLSLHAHGVAGTVIMYA